MTWQKGSALFYIINIARNAQMSDAREKSEHDNFSIFCVEGKNKKTNLERN
jgi:hypothetical protein